MKLALNGALTIGTLDGANVEICERVGAENCFEFGLTTEQVVARWAAGYWPVAGLERGDELRRVIDCLASGMFAGGDRKLFKPVADNLLSSDPFLVLADYTASGGCQSRVGAAYADPRR